MVEGILPQVAPHLIGVPLGRGEQPLYPVWSWFFDVVGQLPTVLVIYPPDEPCKVASSPLPHPLPMEPGRDPLLQLVKPSRPLSDARNAYWCSVR